MLRLGEGGGDCAEWRAARLMTPATVSTTPKGKSTHCCASNATYSWKKSKPLIAVPVILRWRAARAVSKQAGKARGGRAG